MSSFVKCIKYYETTNGKPCKNFAEGRELVVSIEAPHLTKQNFGLDDSVDRWRFQSLNSKKKKFKF
jgi:hypothetical protein